MSSCKISNYNAYNRASWTLGNDPLCRESTYNYDYNIDNQKIWQHTLTTMPPRYPKSKKKSSNLLSDTLPSVLQNEDASRNPKMQKTAISFGNDEVNKVTAYQEFASQLEPTPRVHPCVPLRSSDVISTPCIPTGPSKRSCLNDDFGYFGPRLSRTVYSERRQTLNDILSTHTRDSVAASLAQGRKRKQLTRSMLDYESPLARMKGNIKNMMVRQISPLVRADSIWSSVNNGGRLAMVTESTVNYGWPHASKGMRHFSKNTQSVCPTR